MLRKDSRTKPCPVCGNAAVLISNKRGLHHVCCNRGPTRQKKECKLYVGYEADGEILWFESEAAAIGFWNEKAEESS